MVQIGKKYYSVFHLKKKLDFWELKTRVNLHYNNSYNLINFSKKSFSKFIPLNSYLVRRIESLKSLTSFG